MRSPAETGPPTSPPAVDARLPLPASYRRLWVAYSGGLDSTVLLHRLRGQGAKRLHAVHVDHQLQPLSTSWARRCRETARRWGIGFKLLRVQVQDRGLGPEAAAREARYAAITELLRPGDVLAVAHHRDDQVETVVLRILRGAGVDGLGGMAVSRALGPATLWRPLLDTPRSALRQYAVSHRLRWIEDPHNQDPQYQRVLVRRQLLPAWRALDARVDEQLLAFAANMRQTAAALREQAETDLQRLLAADGSLCLDALRRLPAFRQCQALRRWPVRHGLQPFPDAVVDRVLGEVVAARVDAVPEFHWGEGRVCRYRRQMYWLTENETPSLQPARPLKSARLELPAGAGELRVSGPAAARRELSWAFAAGGERLKPAGEAHTRTLKALFQRLGLPPWIRQRTPLIWHREQLASVAGLWESAAFRDWREQQGVVLQWVHALPGMPAH